MTEITNQLLYEVLKTVQISLSDLKTTLADHTQQFLRVREDIHSLHSDDLRRERMQAQMDTRLQRIETRLNLNDPTLP